MKDNKLPSLSKCFVDTNVWLYSFIRSQDGEKSEISKSIIQEHEVIISTQIINEMCVNLIKKANFTEDIIQQLIASFYEEYTVLELTEDILLKASEPRRNFQFSYWDSLVAASALECEADYLVSEDMQSGFVFKDKLTIINPYK